MPTYPPTQCRPVQISTGAASMPARHSLRNCSAPSQGEHRTPQPHRASLARSRHNLRTTMARLALTRMDRIAYREAAHRTRHGFQSAPIPLRLRCRSATPTTTMWRCRHTGKPYRNDWGRILANVARQQVMTRGVLPDYVPHLPQNRESGALVAQVAH